LFYRVLLDHLEELMPVVYTPTVGQACQEYSHIFRRARGIHITPAHEGRIAEVLSNAPFADVRLIVVTDNERILGLGDQGAGGIGIPIGKLALYTAAAGIHPAQTLPISLDVGTDNPDLLQDELYLGWRQPRLRGEPYDRLVDEFVRAVQTLFPRALLQWEDFKKQVAFDLLDRYRQVLPSFNDDIQGTAAVAVAGVAAATRVSGIPLREQRVVILGAGAAGIGIGRQIQDALQREGLSGRELQRAVAVLDSKGLLVSDTPTRDVYKKALAWDLELAEEHGLGTGKPRDLLAVLRTLKPTVLIGTSGQPRTFTEDVIREMAAHVERPVVFPMSNPTSQSEAVPADVLAWTEGRALVATGSPFAPVEIGGRTVRIGQGNNAYVFPGVGLGALTAEARWLPDSLFTVAAETLAAQVSEEDLASGSLFPPLGELRQVTEQIALAVAREAVEVGVAAAAEATSLPHRVRDAMWEPAYLPIRPV
ncbi:MAG: oxaloacetate-decarboxylating malate dehydrogenase, partial [Armatimonadetes bacterium]|nr:oxaloacetate-decarboxylating malate dehydrogenase [Armatimonadota bacterium]